MKLHFKKFLIAATLGLAVSAFAPFAQSSFAMESLKPDITSRNNVNISRPVLVKKNESMTELEKEIRSYYEKKDGEYIKEYIDKKYGSLEKLFNKPDVSEKNLQEEAEKVAETYSRNGWLERMKTVWKSIKPKYEKLKIDKFYDFNVKHLLEQIPEKDKFSLQQETLWELQDSIKKNIERLDIAKKFYGSNIEETYPEWRELFQDEANSNKSLDNLLQKYSTTTTAEDLARWKKLFQEKANSNESLDSLLKKYFATATAKNLAKK